MSIKPVLILECTNERLGLNESASSDYGKKTGRKEYIMEGVFTQFNLKNRNERVYTPGKFIPHLEELLNRKKELGVVYGEFDHPDVFDTSLSRVSHTIERANYLKNENRIDGAVRLTNTYWGKEAKALVDDELPIFISSRAAGITESNGEVEVKKLFTYDIVADPGFSSAKLNMKVINESCGFSPSISTIKIFDLSDSTKTNELFMENKNDFKTQADMLKYMDYLKKEVTQVKSAINKKVTESVTNTSSKELEQMAEYQESLHEQMAHIIKYLDYIAENVTISLNESAFLNKKTDAIVEHNDLLASEIEKTIHHSDYLTRKINETIHFGNYIVEHLNNSLNYNEYITENLNKAIRFGNYLGTQLDTTIGYTELLAEQLNNSQEYSEYLKEQVNLSINYIERVGNTVNKVIDYNDYMGGLLETTIGFTDLLSVSINNSMEYGDYVIECVDKTMEFADNIRTAISNKSNSVNESAQVPTASQFLGIENEKEEEEKSEDENDINTNKTSEEENETCDLDNETKEILESIKNNTGGITEGIHKLIAEAVKTEASKEEEPHFYTFLTREDIKSFESLNSSDKDAIKLAIKESQGYWTRADVIALMQSTISTPSETPVDKLLKALPDSIKPIWESLTEQDKTRLIAESSNYVLETDEERTHFWETRRIGLVTESKRHLSHTNLIQNDTLNDDDVKNFMSRFKMLG